MRIKKAEIVFTVECPHCDKIIESVLDRVASCLEDRWLTSQCKYCNENYWISFKDELIVSTVELTLDVYRENFLKGALWSPSGVTST